MVGHRESTVDEGSVVEDVPLRLFVGGQWRAADGGRTMEVEDPSMSEILTAVADASPADAVAALDAAVAARAEWARHPPRARSEILHRAFQAMAERSEELALLMTLEMGKALPPVPAPIYPPLTGPRW